MHKHKQILLTLPPTECYLSPPVIIQNDHVQIREQIFDYLSLNVHSTTIDF